MSKKPPEPKTRLSGFCNPTLPRTAEYDPHQNCRGCDCTATGCPCAPESDPPMTDDPDLNAKIDALHGPGAAAALDAAIADGSVFLGAVDSTAGTLVAGSAAGPPAPTDVLDALRDLADLLGRVMLDYHAEDWRDAVRLLRDLREVTRELGKVDAQLVRWLYMHGEHGHHMQIEGVSGNVAIGRGRAKIRWAAREAVFDYIGARIRANDGEMPDPTEVADWVMEVVPATASTDLRKTPLRKMDLDPEDYCTSEPGTISVSILT